MVTRTPYSGIKRPVNSGLANRADRRLQGIATAYAEKFDTSLAVDGVVAFIWNKVKGTTQCTCRGFTDHSDKYTPVAFGTGVRTVNSIINGLTTSEINTKPLAIDSKGQFTYTGSGSITHQNLDAALAANSVPKEPRQRPHLKSDFLESYQDETGDFKDENDILAALETDDSPKGATNTPGTPVGFPSRLVACPICFGMGTIDTWTLYNGERIVLDASNRYDLHIFDSEIEPVQPARFTIHDEGILWKGVTFPVQWRHLLKVAVYDRGVLVDPEDYYLSFTHPSSGSTKNPLNYNALVALNDSAMFKTGLPIDIYIESSTDNPVDFTHVEILFSLGSPVAIQVPDLEIPDDSEYVDWNLNTTFEVSSKVQVRESSYIVEGKYKRIWKVTSINRKITAAGKAFGYSVSCRALQPFEKAAMLLNVFGKPMDPFSTIVDDLILDDL